MPNPGLRFRRCRRRGSFRRGWQAPTDRIPLVTSISTARQVGVVARVAGRFAARRNRRFGAVLQAGRVTLHSFARVCHLRWLEVSGFFFLALAAIFGITLYELYPRFQSGNVGAGKMAVTVCFMVLFAYFGVSSFWRVRKKNLTERS